MHQIAAVYRQLADGIAAAFGKLQHTLFKNLHVRTPLFDIRRVGVGVKVGVFQSAEAAQKAVSGLVNAMPGGTI